MAAEKPVAVKDCRVLLPLRPCNLLKIHIEAPALNSKLITKLLME